MLRKRKLLILFLGVLFLLCPSMAMAHDATIDDPFKISLNDNVFIDHIDEEPFKGTLTLTIENDGDTPWGDFHFYSETDGVFFKESAGKPNMTGATPYTYTIDSNEQQLNYYFYEDPVNPGEQVTFSLYTDNTGLKNRRFSISFEPSPVPVPAAFWLLGSGIIGLVGLRKKSR